jgi:hypothetical protein
VKINPNSDPLRVDGTQAPKPVTPANPPVEEPASFAGSAAVNSALGATPDSRAEVVARARTLVNDPSYPGNEILQQVSRLLAGRLGGAGD